MARSGPTRTAVCILRVEPRGETGMLITVITTPDVTTTSPGRRQTVASVDQALSLVAGFLRGYEPENVYNNGAP
jgi:hypothetical protein